MKKDRKIDEMKAKLKLVQHALVAQTLSQQQQQRTWSQQQQPRTHWWSKADRAGWRQGQKDDGRREAEPHCERDNANNWYG